MLRMGEAPQTEMDTINRPKFFPDFARTQNRLRKKQACFPFFSMKIGKIFQESEMNTRATTTV